MRDYDEVEQVCNTGCASQSGSGLCGLVAVEGRSTEESTILHGDATEHLVEWQNPRGLSLLPSQFHLRFAMSHCQFYSFFFR